MKRLFTLLLFVAVFIYQPLFAQDDDSQTPTEQSDADSVEVYLIDSYITPEMPYKFKLTFSTSQRCISKVILMNKYTFDVSKELSEDHKAEIDVSSLKFDSSLVPFVILVQDSLGRKNYSEQFETALPGQYKIESKDGGSTVLLNCCIGGIIFGLPAPAYVSMGGKDYFSVVKEIPILSIYAYESNYPVGYFAVDYQHVFNAPERNFFKFGYKHIFEMRGIEYLSAGIKALSNFDSYNGLSAELSAGLFRFYDIFTVYTKYSYNKKLGRNGPDDEFHSISLGLFSSAFTLHLNL